ncbi:MAG: hypothetical protein LBH59_05375 [Planctomycetaceae bacterium]|jgi:hypothetical protein|nr:hypothetical protein [Planctomycetaceae bacterium]
MPDTTYLLIFAIIIIIISLMVQLRKRHRLEVERKKRQYEAIVAAQKERKDELIQKGEDTKTKAGTSEMTRVPIGDPFSNKFSGGSSSHGQFAKLEAEIFTLGRQLIGQLDSKMIAIETLTLEANRASNRLELLIDHFERIANKLENYNKNQTEPITQNQNNIKNIIPNNPSTKSTITLNENTQPTNFKDYLNELETEINSFQDKVDEFGKSKEVTILRAVENQEKKLPDNSDKITTPENNPTQTTRSTSLSSNTDPFALSAPRFPGSNTNENNSTKIPTNNQTNKQPTPTGLSFDTLFNDSATQTTTPNKDTNNTTNTNLPNRKQIEMLANYGYSIKEIAQNLNIPIGEVDLILSTRR